MVELCTIKGYETLHGYFLTSCGRIWSTRKYKNGAWLTMHRDKDGYLKARGQDGKRRIDLFVHRLVARAFIPNPNNYDTVDHIDCNKEHNYINNLQWMSRSDNTAKSNHLRKGETRKKRCKAGV